MYSVLGVHCKVKRAWKTKKGHTPRFYLLMTQHFTGQEKGTFVSIEGSFIACKGAL